MGVKAGEEEVVAGADEPDLLSLHQHVRQDLLLAVQHNQVRLGEKNLFKYVSKSIIILLQLFND